MADGSGGPLGIGNIAEDFVQEFKKQGQQLVKGVGQQADPTQNQPQGLTEQILQKKKSKEKQGEAASLQVINAAIQRETANRQKVEEAWRQTKITSTTQPMHQDLAPATAQGDVGLKTVLSGKRAEMKGNKSGE